MQSRASEIIEYLGGTNAVARGLRHRWPTTVQGWKDRGIVPATRIPEVIAFAATSDRPLAYADFFKSPGEPFGQATAKVA